MKYKKFLKNCKSIEEYYQYLIDLTNRHYFVGSINEWIIDNYYIIVEIKNGIKKQIKENKKLKEKLDKSVKLYSILNYICEKNNYNITYEMLIGELKSKQKANDIYLSYDLIEIIPIFLSFIIVDRLQVLCSDMKKIQIEKQNIINLVKMLEIKIKTNEEIILKEYITIGEDIINYPEVIEQLNDSLKKMGSNANAIFVQINNMLQEYNLDIKQLINMDHQISINNNILIANLFNSVRTTVKLKTDDLFDKLSRTEQVLKQDSYYKKMTSETKALYRGAIRKKVKGKKEYDYVKRMLDKSIEDDKHIGFYLLKNQKNNLKSKIYVFSIILFTIIITILTSFAALDYWLLSFIILLVPISELVIQLTNKVLLKFYPCKPLPKMDFSRGLSKDNATVVVIPTIIKSKEKIDKMFRCLEKYYLANKSNYLYFSLLGDCSETNTELTDYDDELAQYGLSVANKLNEQYNKKIFSFAYRKRIYNNGENKYLGYERKRGALIHFNKLLLNKMSEQDIEKYFFTQNVTEIHQTIKYVITIDADTELLLNTALSLVGTMAHPLNNPVLNRNRTKVISGYGIIQPKVNVDVESTNKSMYSQLMAGIGGFDVYSTVVPNFYQDVFGEGSFIGKGIYDLSVFDEILSETFPENLILSHDLLEGNYLRCGFASDIELIDDFPSEFLVESSRQHRWTRGDVQILGWLKKQVDAKNGKKIKNPLNLIEKFKIFDNVRRILINPSLLLLILLSFVCGNPTNVLVLVLCIIFLPMFFFIKDLLQRQNKKLFTFKYYNSLIHGFMSVLYRVIVAFITIPYYSYVYLDALIRALYRVNVSHKNLLNWLTAEDAAKTIKKDLWNYIKQFKINYIASALIIMLSILFKPQYLLIAAIISVGFISAPIVLWYFSQSEDVALGKLNNNQNDQLKDVAYRTWLYFETLLTEENNYLIPDNLQLNRDNKVSPNTSPTDIGMSIISIVSASELGFIGDNKSLELLNKVISSVEKLEKWRGHLYNWYDIKSMKKIVPFVISSVDSGNFAASLVVAKEYCFKKGNMDLYKRISNIFELMNFSGLYTDKETFSVSYNTVDEELSIYNYNNFASESRILSFVAIMKGDVPSKHWLCLNKTLTKYKKHKGLVSWSGTSFEYFMPLIFMKSYPNTLLDESYFFSKFCQKNYMNEIDSKMPWGISESAYDELDDGLNYKYKAFATPYLRVIDEKDDRLVLSPYASILAITNDPADVYHNLKKFRKLKMYGDLGFYESYDYTTENRVLAYYAHHQGMILAALTNYLRQNAIQDYFHSDLRTQAFEILLKEKVQLNPIIDMKIIGYKKFDYEREKIANDIREYNYISDIPQLSVLSNGKYTLLINDRGNGFSRYKTTQLNRYRKITEQDYGTYLYIKDLSNNKVWSNTFAPTNIEPDKYNVVFANDRIKYLRSDDNIVTQTEITVTKEHASEIRKITIKNNTNIVKKLELTSYNEVIISENIDDINHRTFRNLFISSNFDNETKTLIMRRRNNSKKTSNYMFGKLMVKDHDSYISYETERDSFIGRGNNLFNAKALQEKLTNSVGTNIDPIMALRTVIEINPNEEKVVYYIQGFSKSMDGVNEILKDYSSYENIEKAFKYSSLANNMNIKLLGINGDNIRTYNTMLNYLYQTSRHFVNEERKKILAKNGLTQSGLWKFGISGDRPIILVDIHSGESSRLAKDLMRAYEYFKSKGIYIDLVIINSEEDEYKEIIKKDVEQEMFRMNKLFDFQSSPGNIYLLKASELKDEEKTLLNMVARLAFRSDSDTSLEEAIDQMQLNNKIINFPKRIYDDKIKLSINTTKIDKFNSYGGFINEGKEYLVINQDTPVAWSNVIANKNFGTIVTNNECGFTYSENSQMFKLTSWTNDPILNDKSEGITINGKEVQVCACRHGYGYSIFTHEGKSYELDTIQFVADEDKIKFYKNKIKNTTNSPQKYNISFWINPTLGPNEEKSSRYLLSEYSRELDAVIIRNVYNTDFSSVSVFLSATLPIKSVSLDRIISKSISIEVDLNPGEEKEFSFMIGTGRGQQELLQLIEKYKDNATISKEYKNIVNNWDKILSTIKIKTPDQSFNYMMNGWYLYQTISSRILARAGFYQVGGAYGYRDQLQDSMNICEINPSITKKQIIKNAMHQFKEGDVLHWWHEINKIGLRSRYMDDYLWLVYATNRYIKVTGDIKILEEEVCFVEGDALLPTEAEKGINYRYSEDTLPLIEHLKLSINRVMNNMGSNGLPLMGGGDWNDGMNKVGIEGKGTSVWLGFFTYMLLKDFIDVCDSYNIAIDKKTYNKFLSNLKETLNNEAWDGDYYIRAFFDNGYKLGSNTSEECQIDLISQSFSILSDVIPFERIGTVIKSVEDILVDKDLKIIKLLNPPFKASKNIPGYIMDYPQGIRENGGQYTHSVAWYIMALIKCGYVDRAYKYYQMINPVNRTESKESADKYCIEPYVIAADIYSNSKYSARGGWSWYTGSAGWFYNVGLTKILGFTKEGNYLRIEPNTPSEWKNYEIEYRYIDTLYKIKVNLNKEKNSIMVDGESVNSNSIKLKNDKRIHAVIINIKGGR
ncbi:MAG: hypothetical protein IJO43_04885 [Bacilli bacterium]|nr:hypothetical protein [Bacilli bacterium]